MTRKTSSLPNGQVSPLPERNTGFKEPWHFDFDNEPVNDEKWSCTVTAAIPAEAQDEKVIQIYTQCVDTGLRKAVKIISMTDVVKLLKDKPEKPSEQESNLKAPDPQFPQIIELAAKFATFSDTECMLPSDLMAAVLKYMILNLKYENCLAKRIAAVKDRKMREQNIKTKFIRDLKPYEAFQEERKSSPKVNMNILELKKPIDDEPIAGPDLYIMLVDFYDVFVFPELLRINVPFLAILKISGDGISDMKLRSSTLLTKSDGLERKRFLINSFWETIKEEECLDFEMNMKHKNIAVFEYNAFCNQAESPLNFFKEIFEALTWIQYSAYFVYRQHQKYLKELYVQRLILSLEPLDLSKCEIYNKLCDALITGEPLTPLLVLYAVIEQVVAGVPETESVALEYEPQFTDFFSSKSESITTTDNLPNRISSLATSCKCRYKQYENFCEKLKKRSSNNSLSEKNEWVEFSRNSISPQSQYGEKSSQSSKKLNRTACSEFSISESFINEIISNKKTEKEMQKEKRWKTPDLCFYGDLIFLQTYFCDLRLLDPESIIERFLKKLELPQIWKKYPELRPEERVFYNFHFFNLWNNSEECEEKLKLKVLFTCFSLNLIGIKKTNLFLGGEEKKSEISSDLLRERTKILKIKFKENVNNTEKKDGGEDQNFHNFFLKAFIKKTDFAGSRKRFFKMESAKPLNYSSSKLKSISSQFLRRITNQALMFTPIQNTTILSFPQNFSTSKIQKRSSLILPRKNTKQMDSQEILFSLIDCSEISNLTEHNFFRNESDLNIIQDYKFYEKLNPDLMIQRLTEAQMNFNTVQCSYFPPTESIIIIMHNDCDEKGFFFSEEQGVLLTPIGFRDFYRHVYPNIKSWLLTENEEYMRFVSELKEKEKAEKEKEDLKYLTQLKKEYCEMSEEKRKEFLETNVEVQIEPEISEKELDDLYVKPKPQNSEKISFVTTNLIDIRVETNQINHEFHSSDGTEVHTAIDAWLYAPLRLHKLTIKKSKLWLYYNQWLDEEEINFSFTLKTISDIIFSFHKNDSEEMNNFNYYVTISWPTGLLIKPIFHGSSTYIKQGYLKTYRKGWDIEEERSRCFLQNGQILIFKENGNYDILCGSGTKYTFKNSETYFKYEIISTTGEIWEVRSNGPCRNKKELIKSSKIFVGVDPKTQETFYRREDGVFFMLWQNGSLVTNYPDGTKITSIPYFEEREVMTEWSEEEKLYYEELEANYRSEISVQEPRSRTILKSISVPKSIEKKSLTNEGFTSVFCEYVMEHPKYSTVCFNQNSYIKMKMPEQLSILIRPNGNYEVQQEKEFLNVDGSTVQFFTRCEDCQDLSTVTLNIDSNEILCKCVDFFKKAFFVFRNGRTIFKNFYKELFDDREDYEYKQVQEKSHITLNKCATEHNQKMASMQRCFALDRDLSGLEFIHSDTLGIYCYHLSEETYFDIDMDDPLNISCTFSSPTYAIGYEKWVMDYENAENSLPKNIKKKDLKELGVKETPKKLFKYPFPRQRIDRQQHEKPKRVINMPKLIIGRTIKCLCQDPSSVISEVEHYVAKYQKKAAELYKTYKSHKKINSEWQNSNLMDLRLRKIALTLNRDLQMYPHLGTLFPSTEKDIHYFGHFINFMDGMKDHLQDDRNILPNCKQIPRPLPRSSNLPDICEEVESPRRH